MLIAVGIVYNLFMLKILLIFIIFSVDVYAQKLVFKRGNSFDIDRLKKDHKIIPVEVWNYEVRSFEKYNAFNLKDILDAAFGENKWRNNFALKVYTLDGYTPLIEMYKFDQRFPYLAFEKSDRSKFSTIQGHKDKIIDLNPFYLIWRENYKKKAARRRDHWPYKITGFELVKHPPFKIIPEQKVDKDIMWGYKNYLKQCIACHSINNVGGSSGGKMFKEVKIEGKTDKYLHRFISNPRSFGKKKIMPPFPRKINMRSTRIKNIVKYLRYIEKRDFKEFEKSLSKNNKSKYFELLRSLKDIK